MMWSYGYDFLGETMTETDQNGSTHTYSYDSLGRTTLDAVTTLGSGVDGSILALGYAFTALSLPYQQTSYSNSGGTTVVNQVQDAYNGLQQLVMEYQERTARGEHVHITEGAIRLHDTVVDIGKFAERDHLPQRPHPAHWLRRYQRFAG